MSPIALKNLKEAVEFVEGECRKRTAAEVVIQAMIRLYAAKRSGDGYDGKKLRCAGVVGSSTSTPATLLSSWARCARRRLDRETVQ